MLTCSTLVLDRSLRFRKRWYGAAEMVLRGPPLSCGCRCLWSNFGLDQKLMEGTTKRTTTSRCESLTAPFTIHLHRFLTNSRVVSASSTSDSLHGSSASYQAVHASSMLIFIACHSRSEQHVFRIARLLRLLVLASKDLGASDVREEILEKFRSERRNQYRRPPLA